MENHIKFIRSTLKKRSCSNIKVGRGHEYFSLFFTSPTGQVYYMAWHDGNYTYLIRTAEHYKDWKGGSNMWVHPHELESFRLK
jgi:hypothetical protein